MLREVEAGETLTITNHGKAVAVLVPPNDPSRIARLRIREAVERGGFAKLASVEIDHPIQQTLDELRGD